MLLNAITAIILVANVQAAARAADAVTPAKLRGTQYETWQRADINGDGRLTREEARRVQRLARAFDTIDRDADGAISAGEVRVWRAERRKIRPRPQGADEIFRIVDINRDGILSRDEIAEKASRLTRRFDALDTDRDGQITRAELAQWLAARGAARRAK